MNEANEQTSPNKNQSKKAYQQPRLQVYGDLKDITQSHALGMTMDGGMGMGTNKTTP